MAPVGSGDHADVSAHTDAGSCDDSRLRADPVSIADHAGAVGLVNATDSVDSGAPTYAVIMQVVGILLMQGIILSSGFLLMVGVLLMLIF